MKIREKSERCQLLSILRLFSVSINSSRITHQFLSILAHDYEIRVNLNHATRVISKTTDEREFRSLT